MTTSSIKNLLEKRMRDAFGDIIDGKNVKRSRHELRFGGMDLSDIFVEELQQKGYTSATVNAIPVQKGYRISAFYIEDSVVYFGWVFWEKFSEEKWRKLFGSLTRNRKGDREIQLSSSGNELVYANLSLQIEMDIDRPI
jgi:hypothetical protein